MDYNFNTALTMSWDFFSALVGWMQKSSSVHEKEEANM